MIEKFYPCEYVKSVFDIEFKKLYDSGIKAVIFDIDNTLVFQDEDSTKETERLFSALHKLGLKTMILSNNNEERVRRFLRNIDSPYICKAYKPFRKGYLKALERLGVKKEEAVFVGDQLFTDILGANRCGIRSILVRYIEKSGSKPQLRRKFEKAILRSYLKKHPGADPGADSGLTSEL